MNVEAVDLGEEIGVRVQLHLDLAPVVIGRPIPRERLNEGELHALRKVRDGFLLRESCRRDAPAHFVEFRVCSLETKRTNRGLVSSVLGGSFGNGGWCHADLLRTHETRRPTADLSDEGIDDTFVSVRSHAHTWRIGIRKKSHAVLQLRDALELKGVLPPRYATNRHQGLVN